MPGIGGGVPAASARRVGAVAVGSLNSRVSQWTPVRAWRSPLLSGPLDAGLLQPAVEQRVAGHAPQGGGVDVHRQGRPVAEVGDVVDVVRAEGAALALPEVAVVGGAPRPGLLGELALDGEEGALRPEVVVPARCWRRPAS